MLSDENYIRILKYLDKLFWGDKFDDTGFHYIGLTLDWYFDNSIFSLDYIDTKDYFENNGGFSLKEMETLATQFTGIRGKKRLELIQLIITILNKSSVQKEQCKQYISVITKMLERDHVIVKYSDKGEITLTDIDILDSGSYCNIVIISDTVLRKELKDAYKDDNKLQKRIRYEFENMRKLSECPYILKVFDYDETTHSYLMEKADMNLAVYLENEKDLSFEKRLKIMMDVLKGMSFAHQNSIIHRDLHLGNILKIGNDFVVCDFGLSKDTSIERSMKTSYTQKNNHIFVDPSVLTDFTSADKKTDIYSLGKMMDYIFSYNLIYQDHMFKTIVERCICRDKSLRYDSIEHIIIDMETTIKQNEEKENKQNLVNNILNNKYEPTVQDYIMELISSQKLCTFIVKYKLSTFWKLILQFEIVYQIKILNFIYGNFVESTGYGGWSNYDIYAQIAYNMIIHTEDTTVKSTAKSILDECTKYRYQAQKLWDSLF